MSYIWLETPLMGVIFLAALLFATRHFVPGFYDGVRHFFSRKNADGIDVAEMSKTSGIACKTKCSACNGCSLANKS